LSGQRVIDVHCHRECGAAAAMVKPEAERLGRAPLQTGNELTREVNKRQLASLRPKMESIELRLEDMDSMGVDVQALSVSPYQLFHWVRGDLAIRAFQTINDDLAKVEADHPERFCALGAIPMQDPDAAVAEVRRCSTELGFKGIEMATHIEGVEISSPQYNEFWEEVEQLELMVFLHPTGFTDPGRLMDHYFINTIGHPLEETICAGRLIFDGVMERFGGLKFSPCTRAGSTTPTTPGRTYDTVCPGRPASIWRCFTSTPWCSSPTRSGSWWISTGQTTCCWGPTIPTTWVRPTPWV
jgi:aminocarboxymuconate-semialdehyde decarboxylase